MADTHPGPQQRPAALQSSSTPCTISSLEFTTIGKEPDLLKRISAPKPNQNYQDNNASVSSSPPHTPPVQHKEIPSSRPSLLQALTATDGFPASSGSSHVRRSDSPNHTTATPVLKPLGIFDQSLAALYRGNLRVAPSSHPAISRTSSDMDCSPVSASPRNTSHPHANDCTSILQVPGNSDDGSLLTAKSRHASLDSLSSLELAYPATEPALSKSPNLRPGNLNVAPSAGPSVGPSAVHTLSIAELPARLLDFISFLDLAAVQHSKMLEDLTELERHLKAITSFSSMILDNAQRVSEAHMQGSLSTDTLSESIFVAQAAKQRTNQALVAFAQLRRFYENEFHDIVSEQGRANLKISATSLKHDMESIYHFIREQGGHSIQPVGLPPEILISMSIEVARRSHEYESKLGIRKRKRSQERIDLGIGNDLPCPPLKEIRVEQRAVSFDDVLEMEAEAAREAWNREAERRSTIFSDTTMRAVEDGGIPEKHANDTQQKEQAERNAPMTEPAEGDSMGQTEQLATPSSRECLPLLEQFEKDLFSQNSDSVKASGEMEELLAQRRRELEERRLEIARFQLREQESHEYNAERKELDKKETATSQCSVEMTMITPVAASASLNAAVGNGLRCVAQPITATNDVSRKKEIEMRLAMEKQQASATLRPAQGVCVIQTTPPRTLTDQKALSAKDGMLANQVVLRRSSEQLRNADKRERKGDEGGKAKRKTEADTTMKTQIERAKLKERTNGSPEVTTPKAASSHSVGDIVAQQTVTTSLVKGRAKKSRTVTPSVADQSTAQKAKAGSSIQGVYVPTSLTFQPVFSSTQPLNGEDPPQTIRNLSVPPIECIVESNSASSTAPLAQDNGSQRGSLVGPTTPVNISQEAQSANLRFIRTSVSGTTTGPAVPHLEPPTIIVVPKAEVQSPTITHSSAIQQPLPQWQPNNNVGSKQGKANAGNYRTPIKYSKTKSLITGTDFVEHGLSDNLTRRHVLSTSPSTTAPTDMTSNLRTRNNLHPLVQSNNFPHASNAVKPSSTSTLSHANRSGAPRVETRPSRAWAYDSSPHSPPRPVIGRKRLYDLDNDEHNWPPDKEVRDHRKRPAPHTDTYIPSSSSPPPRFHGGSRPYPPSPPGETRSLAMRIEGPRDPEAFPTTGEGEKYLPMHSAYRRLSPMDASDYDMQRQRDDHDANDQYAPPHLRRPELLVRFSRSTDASRRSRGGKRGGRGGPRSLEQRIS